MRRIGLAVVLTVSLTLAPPVVEAQQAANMYRVGLVVPGSASGGRTAAFRQGLRALGYIEGRNIAIEARYADGRADRLPGLVAELVNLKVDVLVIEGNAGINAGRNATKTIPIVMAPSGDPLGAGFVASLARPGGNLTGLSLLLTGLAQKRLELIREAVPMASRLAVLWSPARRATGSITADLGFAETQTAAKSLRVQLQSIEVDGPADFDRAFSTMRREHADALALLSNSLLFTHRQRLTELAQKHQIPAMFEFREFVDAGGLMAYGANLDDLSRRAATYVDKILKGAKPADLPIEQPTKFELVINLKTAKALGLTIPQSILVRADEIIQ
jgi:ABC-type uncharacterized transport system substrate-binding protein